MEDVLFAEAGDDLLADGVDEGGTGGSMVAGAFVGVGSNSGLGKGELRG